jgi:hypothetical protein
LFGVLEEIDTGLGVVAQGTPPIVTAVVTDWSFTVNPVPTIWILVPPAVVPLAGVMEIIVGTGISAILEVAV